jgi:hypothetical protein
MEKLIFVLSPYFPNLKLRLFCQLTWCVPFTEQYEKTEYEQDWRREKNWDKANDGEFCLLQFIYSNEDFSILHIFSHQTHIITCNCWECDTQGNAAVQIVSLLIDSDA